MTFFFIALVVCLACGALGAAIANSNGASGGLGFVVGFVLGPLGVLVAALLRESQVEPTPLPPIRQSKRKTALEQLAERERHIDD